MIELRKSKYLLLATACCLLIASCKSISLRPSARNKEVKKGIGVILQHPQGDNLFIPISSPRVTIDSGYINYFNNLTSVKAYWFHTPYNRIWDLVARYGETMVVEQIDKDKNQAMYSKDSFYIIPVIFYYYKARNKHNLFKCHKTKLEYFSDNRKKRLIINYNYNIIDSTAIINVSNNRKEILDKRFIEIPDSLRGDFWWER